jgi:hypothetical protein
MKRVAVFTFLVIISCGQDETYEVDRDSAGGMESLRASQNLRYLDQSGEEQNLPLDFVAFSIASTGVPPSLVSWLAEHCAGGTTLSSSSNLTCAGKVAYMEERLCVAHMLLELASATDNTEIVAYGSTPGVRVFPPQNRATRAALSEAVVRFMTFFGSTFYTVDGTTTTCSGSHSSGAALSDVWDVLARDGLEVVREAAMRSAQDYRSLASEVRSLPDGVEC